VSRNRVDHATSASSNVTVPAGSTLMSASMPGSLQLVSHMLASMRFPAAQNISEIANSSGEGMRTYASGHHGIRRFGRWPIIRATG
jgi:hypothetical protein